MRCLFFTKKTRIDRIINMRNRLFPFLLIIPMLAACHSSGPLSFVPYTKYQEAQNLNVDEDDNYYYRRSEVNPIVTKKGNFTSFKEFLFDSKDNRHHVIAHAKGEVKMLVLPIRFTNSDNSISLQDKTIYLQNAFFGDSSATKLESVASYYNKSSYGQLKITGEVAPWYELDIASYQWKNKGAEQTAASRKITLEAINQLRNDSRFNLDAFDGDNDGYIDMVYTIYDYPYSHENKDDSSQELFWAYTDFIKENENGTVDKYANAYSWSSLYFSNFTESKKVDASTYIHETGHLLGLSDYYNTNSKVQGYYYQPTGFFDMMDSNQGDHTALSKYLFNWSSPKVIKKGINGVIKLNNFSKTGDYLLIPLEDKYDDNPFGEYLLLEYFCPNGLNSSNRLSYQDVDINGDKVVFTFPTYHGLKVYHVDARLAYYKKKTSMGIVADKICLVEEETSEDLSQAVVDFAFDNSIKTKEADTGHVLYHLLESSGENTFKNGQLASNDTLFRYGDTFGVNTFEDLSNRCGYTFKIVDVSTNNISIQFTSI